MKKFLLTVVAGLISFSAFAQDRMHAIEIEFSDALISEIRTYNGLGASMYDGEYYLAEDIKFFDIVRPLVQRAQFLSNIRSLTTLLENWGRGQLGFVGERPDAAKLRILNLAKLVQLAERCLPESFAKNHSLSEESARNEFEWVKALTEQASPLTEGQIRSLKDAHSNYRTLKYAYENDLRFLAEKWSGKINYEKFKLHVQKSLLETLKHIDKTHQLTEIELQQLIQDFSNGKNGFIRLQYLLHTQLFFEDSSAGYKTNLYKLTQNRLNRIFNTMILAGKYKIQALPIEETGKEKAERGRLVSLDVAENSTIPIDAIKEIVARIGKR